MSEARKNEALLVFCSEMEKVMLESVITSIKI